MVLAHNVTERERVGGEEVTLKRPQGIYLPIEGIVLSID